MQVDWSKLARADAEAIRTYLLDRNPYAAKRILLRLIDATKDLAMFPSIGRIGLDGTREWIVAQPYVLLYEVDEMAEIVKILRVWHSAQDRS